MSTPKTKQKVADNPAAKEMKALLPTLKVIGAVVGFLGKLGIKREAFTDFKSQVDDIAQQATILDLPDLFNAAFGSKGWVAVGSALAVDVMKSALELHDAGKDDEAERVLVDWFTKENIELFAITRARRFHQAMLRDDQLREALKLYLEERYLAAVPLILIACDGFASDVSGISPFAEGANLTAFDSVVGHPTGLPALIGQLKKGAYKSRDDEMTMPERHKIIHGRSLGYANKTVCAKAWLLMMALVDWAIDKSSEEERKAEAERKANISLSDTLAQVRKTEADKRQIEAFEPFEKEGPFYEPLDETSPEKAVFDFLSGWQKKNYGKMAKCAVNLTNKPIKKMAGEMRNMAELVELEQFEFRRIRYSTIARCDARVWVKAKTLCETVEGELDLLVIRYTDSGDVAMPNDDNCVWTVQQLCIYSVMNGWLDEETK
ncbi:hypothetical protein [Celeribacter sp. SCSIO 80788]|uniref:hypothetical protein n=1 Tax=Celeribacter sp. SCSIO 80788 TaxID=3117013 RepID=UPI003DA4AAC3